MATPIDMRRQLRHRIALPRRRAVPKTMVVLPAMAAAFAATLAILGSGDGAPTAPLAAATAPAAAGEAVDARFGLCDDGGETCVVDGDTIHYQGRRIRILDIDTPELHPARCAAEALLGEAAKQRLLVLVNQGDFALVRDGRDRDRYGRELRRLVRGSHNLGMQLVAEGLARPYHGGRRSWC